MKIAAIQMGSTKDVKVNISKAKRMVEQASKQGADLVCLPEIFYLDYSGPFNITTEKYAEVIPTGVVCKELKSWAKEFNIAIIAGIYEKEGVNYYNSGVVIDNRGLYIGKYQKRHIPLAKLSFEKYYFTAGKGEIPIFTINGMTVGILICYDRHFPELARIMAFKGIQVLVVITGAPDVIGRSNTWKSVLITRAIENNIFVLGVNRYGKEDHRTCFGQSMLVNPYGVVKGEIKEGEGILVSEIDLIEIKESRLSFGHFRDFREDSIQEWARIIGNV